MLNHCYLCHSTKACLVLQVSHFVRWSWQSPESSPLRIQYRERWQSDFVPCVRPAVSGFSIECVESLERESRHRRPTRAVAIVVDAVHRRVEAVRPEFQPSY